MGLLVALMTRSMPPPVDGAPRAAAPPLWGDPNVVRERLGNAVTQLRFGRRAMVTPALSPRHLLIGVEATFGPLKTLLSRLDQEEPHRAAGIRDEIEALISAHMEGNILRQQFLMSIATKV